MNSEHVSGVLYIHSCPPALKQHLEWAMARPVGSAVSIDWSEQPALPGTLRGEYTWSGPVGTAAVVASALRGWQDLRFEITEHASADTDGGRWMHTPALGIFYVQTDASGSGVVSEHRLRHALELAGNDPVALSREIGLALGQAWDDELEAFRRGEAGASIHWLQARA